MKSLILLTTAALTCAACDLDLDLDDGEPAAPPDASEADAGTEPEPEPGDCSPTPVSEVRTHVRGADGALEALIIDEAGQSARYQLERTTEDGLTVEAVLLFEPADAAQPEARRAKAYDELGRVRWEQFDFLGISQRTEWHRDEDGRVVALGHRDGLSDTPETPTGARIADAEWPVGLPGDDEPVFAPDEGERVVVLYPLALRDETPGAAEYAEGWALLARPAQVAVVWEDAATAARPFRDTDADGRIDTFAFKTVTRLGDTRTTEWELDGRDSREGHRIEIFDADGVLVGKRDVDEATGTPITTRHETFDGTTRTIVEGEKTSVITYEDGHRVLHTVDDDGDGDIDWRKTYEYDEQGRRTRETRDQNANGSPDQVWLYTYADDGELAVERKFESSSQPLCAVP